ncbi:unnamed protein product, partial [Ixodes pacificus]
RKKKKNSEPHYETVEKTKVELPRKKQKKKRKKKKKKKPLRRHLILLTCRNAKAFLCAANSYKQCLTSSFCTRHSDGGIALPYCAGAANLASFTTATVTKHLRVCGSLCVLFLRRLLGDVVL